MCPIRQYADRLRRTLRFIIVFPLLQSQNYNTTIINACAPSGSKVTETYSEIFEAPCTKDTKENNTDPVFITYHASD